ncbi:hypothetical protein [Paenibacillus sp. HB172176]|uniref:hypothetical protein n=1 Tax=Paenibacillus sp. HB172176 TaxID=2493690 RepID=UPI00143A477C|nr:hypothetical protein [Paenibacillus sp. HB172176]
MISPFFRKKEQKDSRDGLTSELGHEAANIQQEAGAAIVGDELEQELVSPAKTNMDKKSLDLIFAVEQMIQAKQHMDLKLNELQDRLSHANSHGERLTRDVRHLNKVIDEREKSILELEQKIADKNMKVDQVAEDYRELQNKLAAEIEDLKSVIDLEQQKYENLLGKHNDALADKNKRIHELEEKIGRMDVEIAHMKQKYESTHQEKVYLANMINDFTTRMAAPIGAVSKAAND